MTTTAAPLTVNSPYRPAAPQEFASVEEERLFRKQRLAAAFRIFGKYGFDEGLAGHITVRDPELLDHFWVNPLAVPFAHIKVSDLELVSHEGVIVEGNRPINRAAFAIHSQIHAENAWVISAAHAHSLYGKAFSTLGKLLDPITQDSCQFYGSHALFDDYTGVVLDLEEGKKIAGLVQDNKLLILQNHGLLGLGRNVDEAAWHFIAAERSAHAQLLAEAAGTPIFVRHEVAEPIGRQREFGGYSFQPYYEQIVREQPDLFE
jgi:ribulose-5-phosphate 4-epimerase/fuculose-1-phosphate aldolase